MPSLDLIFRFLGVDAGAGTEFDRMGAKTSGLANKVSASSAAIHKAAGATLLAGAAVAAVSIDMAAKFQGATEQIQTQADGTAKQVAKVRTGILNMAGAVASTPAALADAAYHIASIGKGSLTTAQQLNVLRVAAEGAKVGNADLTDVTNGLEAAIVSGIKGAKSYSQAMGILNATVGAGDMHMEDLAQALGTGVVITAKQAGDSLKQVGAALAVFGDNNVRGAKAGTQLRMSIQALEDPMSTGAGQFQKWNLSMSQLAKDMQQGGLSKAISDLRSHMQAAGDTGKKIGASLTDAFGKRAGSGIAALVGEYGRFQNKLKAVGDGGKNFASDWTDYTKMFSYSLDAAKSAGQALLITLGTDLLPVATKVMKWLATVGVPALMSIAHWFEQNKAAAAALGIALVALWEPWLALGIVIVAAYEKSQKFRDVVRDVVSATVKTFDALRTAGLAVWKALDAAWQAFADGPLAYVQARVADFTAFWHSHSVEIREVARTVWKVISTVIETEWRAAMDVLRPGLVVLKALFKTAWDAAKTIVQTAWNVIGDVLKTAEKTTLDFVGVILDLITGHWAKAWTDAKQLVSDSIHGIGAILGDFAKGALGLLYTAGADLVRGLIDGIKSMAGAVGDAVKGLVGSITSPFKKALKIFSPSKVFHQYGEFVVQGLVNGVKSKVVAASEVSKLLAEGMIGGWTGAADRIKNSLSTPIQNALTHLTDQLKAELAKQQAALKATVSHYKQLEQARRQAIGGLKSQIVGSTDISSVLGATNQWGQTYTGNIGSSLSGSVSLLRTEARDLARLRKMGLSQALISQISAQSPQDAVTLAQQILSGQAGSIASLNRNEALIQTYAKRSATTVVESPHEQAQLRASHESVDVERHMLAVLQRMERRDERRAARDVAGNVVIELHGADTKLTQANARLIVAELHKLGVTTGVRHKGHR